MTTQSRIASALQRFNESEFTLGNRRFRVHKLPTDWWNGDKPGSFQVFEMLRTALAGNFPTALAESNEGSGALIIRSLMSIPTETIEKVAAAMYARVEFAPPDSDYLLLTPATRPMAFEEFEPFMVYELIGRCFAVNFTASWDALLSRMAESTPESDSSSPNTGT